MAASRVDTSKGVLEGIERDGAHVFFGVPFASPPVGDARLRPPRPAQAWTGVRTADARPPGPPQPGSGMDGLMGGARREVPQSEDCLYLNVWTPSVGGTRPVMVWLHGGGLMFGWSADPVYDAACLALRGDVVVVTVTYRLGALGVLAHPALRADDTGICGNFHLLDQIAALEWVQDEIGSFGGDPRNVTVFGESAGAMSTGALLGTPRARGLFARAIVQSGGAAATPLDVQATAAERIAVAAGLARGEVAKLRTLPVEVILKAQHDARLQALTMRGGGFTVDGVVLPHTPLEGIRAGTSEGVTVMSGTTRDEAKLFAAGLVRAGRALTDEHLVAYAERVVPRGKAHDAIDVLRAARVARGEAVTPFELRFALQTELEFRRPSIELLEAHLEHTPDAYSYLFTWGSKAMGGALGSPHAIDIPFTFGNFGAGRLTGPVDERDTALCDHLQNAWTSFARGGDPSHASLGTWPRYDIERRATMQLDIESAVVDDPRAPERRLWSEGSVSARA